MRYNMPARHFDTAAYRRRKMAARYFLLAAVIFFVLGCTFCFAAQSGIAIQNRLVNHQHTASGDGGTLQGLAPVGNFKISGNNAGNIAISTSITGSNFIWKPSSTSFIAGQATDDSFYVNNIGGFSWIGGYNAMSRGDYSLSFGTYTKNYRAASVLLGYYLKNNAGNSVMIGSGPGFGPQPYAVNDDTGSIKFFPFTTTSETRPMLNLKRDNTAEAVGVWNFISTPTILGVSISTYAAVDTSKVLKTGDTMTGDLYAPAVAASSLTISNILTAAGSFVGINTNSPSVTGTTLDIATTAANATLAITSYGGTTTTRAGILNLGKSRATTINTWETTYSGDRLGLISFRGVSASSGSTSGAQIAAFQETESAGNFVPGYMAFYTSDGVTTTAERLRISKEGRVGIGTPSPAAKLSVTSTDALVANLSGPANAYFDLTDGVGTLRGQVLSNEPGLYSVSAQALRFGTNNTERMRITSGGLVGIGTNDPKSVLHVVGLPEYADNAAALSGGLTAGAFYRTGDALKIVH